MTEQFSYISSLLSFVIALAITHSLAGIASIARADIQRFSYLQAAWIALMLFSCVDFWFSVWGLRETETWSLAYVIYLLILATSLYLSCKLIMPSVQDGQPVDLVAFNEKNRRKYLTPYFLYTVLATFANLTITGFETAILLNILVGLMILSAWIWSDQRVQITVVVGQILLLLYYAATYIPSL